MSEQAGPRLGSMSMAPNSLGVFLDGWADIAEGIGERVEEVQNIIHQSLLERDMPEVKVEAVRVTAGMLSEKRHYLVTSTYPGITTTIRAGRYGKDLFVTWSTYIKPVFNWKILGGILGVAFLFALIDGGWSSIFTFFGIFGLLFITLSLVGLFGLLFITLSLVGLFVYRDPLWVVIVQPTIFDADDLVAMSLAAHKSILKALDQVGVDIALLRAKQDYHRKRSEEV